VESLGTLLPILLIGVVFYLLIMRPARNRQRKQAEMMSALDPGARIMTTAGVYGTVVAIDDDDAEIEIAPGVVIRTGSWTRNVDSGCGMAVRRATRPVPYQQRERRRRPR
jgi:preprotein translocase YajC subunit